MFWTDVGEPPASSSDPCEARGGAAGPRRSSRLRPDGLGGCYIHRSDRQRGARPHQTAHVERRRIANPFSRKQNQ